MSINFSKPPQHLITQTQFGQCHGSVRQVLNLSVSLSYFESPGSFPGQSKKNMWWMKGHWDLFYSSYLGFSLSGSFYGCPILFIYYCRCVTLATDSILKQYSRMHTHMTHSPTQHTHAHAHTHTHTRARAHTHIHTHTHTQLYSTVVTFTGTGHTDIAKPAPAFLQPLIFNKLQYIVLNFLMSLQIMLSVRYSKTYIF